MPRDVVQNGPLKQHEMPGVHREASHLTHEDQEEKEEKKAGLQRPQQRDQGQKRNALNSPRDHFSSRTRRAFPDLACCSKKSQLSPRVDLFPLAWCGGCGSEDACVHFF